MPLILVFVFLAAFAVVIMVTIAVGGTPGSGHRIRTTLAAALDTSRFAAKEEVIDVRKDNALSSVPWIQRLLENMDGALELQRMLDQADLKWTPMALMLAAALGWVLCAMAINWKLHTGALSLLLALPIGAAPFVYVRKKRAARFFRFKKAMPDALEQMVSALRAGHSLISALGIVAAEAPEPIRREFRICFEEQSFGIDLRTAFENLLLRVPLADLRVVVTSLVVQKESGGNLAEALEKTAALIRERFRLADQIRVHTAQARLTGLILTLLPMVLGGILYVQNPHYMALLFTRPLGQKMLAAGVALNIAGMLIIRKIIRIRV